MTDKEVIYTVLIGTGTMFVLISLFLIFYVRAYNKKFKIKKEKNAALCNFKLNEDMFKTTKHKFCRCLHEIENGLPRTKHCARACNDQIEILSRRAKDNT